LVDAVFEAVEEVLDEAPGGRAGCAWRRRQSVGK